MKVPNDIKEEYYYTSKIRILFVLLMTLAERAIFLAPAIIVGKIIDLVTLEKFDQLNAPLILLLCLGLFQTFLWPIRERFVASVVQSITLNRSIRITKLIFMKQYELFAPSRVGHVTKVVERAIEGFERLLNVMLTQALPALVSVIFVTIYFIVLLPIGAPILIIGSIVYLITSYKVLRWRRKFLDKVNDSEDDIADNFASTFLAARAIKSNGTLENSLMPLEKTYKSYAKNAEKLSFASGVLFSAQSAITLIITLAAIYGGVIWIEFNNSFTAGDFVIVFTYVGIFMSNLSTAWQIRESIDEYEADSRALSELQKAPEMAYEIDPSQEVPKRPNLLLKASTQTQSVPINIVEDIEIPFGKFVAVSGSSGSGKTTLLQIMANVRVTNTKLHINKHCISKLSQQQISATIAYAWQEPQFLFGEWDEAVFLRKISEKDIKKASILSNKLGISHLFQPNEKQFRTDQLSGGEKKRLALLRILLSNKPILIFDEPTNEIDLENSQAIIDFFKEMRGEHTLIFATHDQKLKSICDMEISVQSSSARIV